MANYSLVADTAFKARSFKDLIEPYLLYTKDYREQEDALGNLSLKAAAIQALANEQTDPLSYAKYTNFANTLKEQASLLSNFGLNSSSRQSLLNLKRRYASEILPIEVAAKKREAQIDEQRKASLADPTLLINRDASTTSLDEYVENPALSYETYSGALLTKQMADMAKTLADDLMTPGDNKTKRQLSQVLPFQYVEKLQKGLTRKELSDFLKDPNTVPVLKDMTEKVLNSSKISSWNDPNITKKAIDYINQGIWSAEGTTEERVWTDDYNKQKALIDYNYKKAPKVSSGRGRGEGDGKGGGTIAVRGSQYMVSNKKLSDVLKTLKGGNNSLSAAYYGKNGNVNPIKAAEGWRLYARKHGTSDKAFNDYCRALGISKVLTPEEYNILKGAGYTGSIPQGQTGHYYFNTEFSGIIGKTTVTRTRYSTAMNPNVYEREGAEIGTIIGSWSNRGSLAGLINEVNNDGTLNKKTLKYNNLNLFDDNGKSNITDIIYDPHIPNKIIIRVGSGNQAKLYAVDPAALGSEVDNFIKSYAPDVEKATGNEKTEAGIVITQALSQYLNSRNNNDVN